MIVSQGTKAPRQFEPGDRVAYLTDGGRSFRIVTVKQLVIRSGPDGELYVWRYIILVDGKERRVEPRMLQSLPAKKNAA